MGLHPFVKWRVSEGGVLPPPSCFLHTPSPYWIPLLFLCTKGGGRRGFPLEDGCQLDPLNVSPTCWIPLLFFFTKRKGRTRVLPPPPSSPLPPSSPCKEEGGVSVKEAGGRREDPSFRPPPFYKGRKDPCFSLYEGNEEEGADASLPLPLLPPASSLFVLGRRRACRHDTDMQLDVTKQGGLTPFRLKGP